MRNFKAEKKRAVRRLRKQARRLIAAGLVAKTPEICRMVARLEQNEGGAT